MSYSPKFLSVKVIIVISIFTTLAFIFNFYRGNLRMPESDTSRFRAIRNIRHPDLSILGVNENANGGMSEQEINGDKVIELLKRKGVFISSDKLFNRFGFCYDFKLSIVKSSTGEFYYKWVVTDVGKDGILGTEDDVFVVWMAPKDVSLTEPR